MGISAPRVDLNSETVVVNAGDLVTLIRWRAPNDDAGRTAVLFGQMVDVPQALDNLIWSIVKDGTATVVDCAYHDYMRVDKEIGLVALTHVIDLPIDPGHDIAIMVECTGGGPWTIASRLIIEDLISDTAAFLGV